MLLEDFEGDPQARWTYVADTVMGGISDGKATFQRDANGAFVRLTGSVSTANNGGFIQVRIRFDETGWPEDVTRLVLDVRGNGERYHIFLRSRHGTKPWHSYRATFEANADWQEVVLPIADFEPSRDELPAKITAGDVTGLGIVAYGADFEADVSVSGITLT